MVRTLRIDKFRFAKSSVNAFPGAALPDQRGGMRGVRDIFEGAPRFEVRVSATEVRWFECRTSQVTLLSSFMPCCVGNGRKGETGMTSAGISGIG